ncbi:hypothetical protein EVAR_73996_1 [Eumeta japonica]|uniref:Calcyclin-binding protein n=1 Tax=Eumeta variegata TaxID=151549 RepID=A0A4C1TFU4_EUMVA|nr:hypothetical protein EVAR_73996_1 [Eumeta japonica]
MNVEETLAEATRKRVKDALVYAKAEVDREIVTLRLRLSKLKNKKSSKNPEDALVNILKKCTNQGDTKTKQMIAKAWTESQEKIHKGDGGGLIFHQFKSV